MTRRGRDAEKSARVLVAGLLVAVVGLGSCGKPRTPPLESRADHTAVAGVDSTSVAAAAEVVRGYYAAIGAHDYRRAYDSWEHDGAASGKSYEEFVAGFANTAEVEARIGEPGRMDAAAGSRYVEVPVTIRALDGGGTEERFAGEYVMRRSEVDGATHAQRHWHIYTAQVRRVR